MMNRSDNGRDTVRVRVLNVLGPRWFVQSGATVSIGVDERQLRYSAVYDSRLTSGVDLTL
jgi:hypothetical protein